MSETASDAQLVDAAQGGNRDAWGILCHRHAPRLCAYLGSRLRRPKVVEKLVEEAIVAAWRHLHELTTSGDFAGWFRRIGANLALRWFHEHKDESLSEPFPAERCGGDLDLLRRMAKIETVFAGLSDPQRMALEQRYRGRMSGEDLSQSLRLGGPETEKLLDEAIRALEAAWGDDPA